MAGRPTAAAGWYDRRPPIECVDGWRLRAGETVTAVFLDDFGRAPASAAARGGGGGRGGGGVAADLFGATMAGSIGGARGVVPQHYILRLIVSAAAGAAVESCCVGVQHLISPAERAFAEMAALPDYAASVSGPVLSDASQLLAPTAKALGPSSRASPLWHRFNVSTDAGGAAELWRWRHAGCAWHSSAPR